MPRLCVFVCVLMLLVSVQSKHFVKFSYEEVEDGEGKDSAPMMELMKPLNVLPFQQERRLTYSSWNNCGKPSKIINLTKLAVIPDPVKVGAIAHVTVQGTMDQTVSRPIEVDVTAKYKVRFVWVPMPCVHGYGSCVFKDICPKLPSGTCPIKKGKININKSFIVPKIPSGHYRLTATLKSKGTWLACFQVNVAVSN
ncbi:ganglioside GM2 activator-like [Littorina saxatilis]|uniref:MD-2-related lipid-recognition domain-containing protein n=1 Tax=Littorina saxatilis TaxID=31220 RepID=A0AAN9BXN2_9CAEN